MFQVILLGAGVEKSFGYYHKEADAIDAAKGELNDKYVFYMVVKLNVVAQGG